MEKNEISEEVTVTPVIRDLERLFGRLVNGIKNIFLFLVNAIRLFFLFAIKNAIILLIATLLGGAIGVFSTKFIPRKYASSMTVKLNVEGKEQLINDVDYFNALISKNENGKLAELLMISEGEAASLTGFEVYPYSNIVERTIALNDLYSKIDTTIYNRLELDQLITQNDIELSSKFKITIKATEHDVFSELEKPVLAYLERVPELNELLERGMSALEFQRKVYIREMDMLDTLIDVMNKAMLEEAKRGGEESNDTYVLMSGDRNRGNQINALDIQDKYNFYVQKLMKVDVAIAEHESCYFVNSHLNPYGEKVGYGRLTRGVILAVVFFGLTYLILVLFNVRKKTA